MTATTEVTRLSAPQISETARVLARAFHHDPWWMFVVPHDAERARLLPWFMEPGVRHCHMFGEVYATEGGIQGAANWLTPGNIELTRERIVESGIASVAEKVGAEAYGRFISLMAHLQPLHNRDVPPQHYYLMILGVDPPRQGQGVGSTLIQPVLAHADAERLPCYLETAKERNVPFYQKHGFGVVVEGDLPKGGPHFWTMKREPQRM